MSTIPKNGISIFLVAVLLFVSCSRYYDRSIEGESIYEQIDRSTKGRESTIKMIDGESFTGTNIKITEPVISWDCADSNMRVKKQLSTISFIQVKKRNTLIGGLILGSVAAVFIIGAGIAWENPGQGFLASPLAFIVGFMPGAMIGSLYTRVETFRINDEYPTLDTISEEP